MKKLILFIHGLGGDGENTWKKEGNQKGFFELIREDNELYKQYDIGSYFYPTSLFRLPFFRKSLKIQDLANGLRTSINNKYKDYESITLVCHSLGGLIARLYLIEEVKNQKHLKVDKLLLYAVPNNGAGLASIAKHISWKNNQLAQLCKNSDLIDLLNEDWFRLEISKKLDVKYIVASLDKVVDSKSAESFWGNPKIETIVNSGHLDIVKPENPNDMSFLIFKNFVDTSRSKAISIDLTHKQKEKGTEGWIGFNRFLESYSKESQLIDPGSLENIHLLNRLSTLVLVLPYESPFTDIEAQNIRTWVENGGGLFMLGYYAADTHHFSNPSRIAREFKFEFKDNLVMPETADEHGCRAHVFGNDKKYSIKISISDDTAHPIVKGVQKLSFMSSCSIKTDYGSGIEFILKSSVNSNIWHPEGPKGPEGWSRKIIERWILDGADAVPLLVAFKYGRGKVVLSGTWKLLTLQYDDNNKLVGNILQWLSN